jgi:triphosphatase
LLTETLNPLRERLDDPGLKRLCRIAEQSRAEGHRHLREMLASRAYTELKLSLLELLAADWSVHAGDQPLTPWIDPTRNAPPWAAPVEVFADRMLRKRHKKLRHIGNGHAAMSVEELHELRIAAKKLRYAADFFRSLYPKKRVRRYVAALSALQDCLGAINDGAVGRARVAEAWEKLGGLSRRSTRRARAEGAVEGWFAAVEHVEFSNFAAHWRRFLDVDRFWHKPRALTDY